MSIENQRRLFSACLDAETAEEREQILASCPDPALRAEVRSLLRAHDESADSLPPVAAEWAFPRIAHPHQIGPYRLLERIGEGGMGEVFLAAQQSPVVRRVAIKILKFGLGTREVLARFEQERQTLAVLAHENIARIFDAGATDDGRPWFAMEYVPGVPVTRYCEEHKLDLAAVLKLFLQICAGVQHAHLRGVIHRDLKPSNILVCEVDGSPVPKIIDFGIAKATTPSAGNVDAFTRFGALLGTPDYMSPEQAQLSPLDVDARTDVYSLGVVLYQMLTGARPYSVTSDAVNPAVLLNEILSRDPRRPSEVAAEKTPESEARAAQRNATPAALAARLRGDLDWIVLKAIEKDRQRRYDSPAALAADLQRYANDEPVSATPPSTLYRAGKFARRHRLAVSAASLIFLTVLVFGSAMAWFARQAAAERDRANLEAETARSINAFIVSMFEDANPYGAAGRTMTADELLREARARIDERFERRPDLRVELLQTVGGSLASLGDLAGAEAALRRGLEESLHLYGPQHVSTLRLRVLLTDVSAARRDAARLRSDLAELLPLVRPIADSHPELLVRLLKNQANLDFIEGRWIDAEAPAREAFELARRTLGEHHALTLATSALIAESYLAEGRSDEAMLAESERALQLALAAHGGRADHAGVIRMREVRGRALASAGRIREAVAELQAALEGAQSALGPESIEAAAAMANIAPYERRLGELERALERCDAALEIFTRHIDRASADFAYLLVTRGVTLIAARRPQQALADLTEAEATYTRLFGPMHWDTLTARFNRAVALAYLNRFAEARAALAPALDPATPIANGMWTAHVIGVVDRLEGKATAAVAHQKEAEDLIVDNARADWDRLRVFAELGLAELDAGDVDEAVQTLERTRALFETLNVSMHPAYAEVLEALERTGRAAG